MSHYNIHKSTKMQLTHCIRMLVNLKIRFWGSWYYPRGPNGPHWSSYFLMAQLIKVGWVFSSLMWIRDWKIGKYRRYFEEISDIGQHRNDNRHRLSIDGKIGKKSAKSSIYRRNIGEAPIYRRKIASGLTRGAIGGEF